MCSHSDQSHGSHSLVVSTAGNDQNDLFACFRDGGVSGYAWGVEEPSSPAAVLAHCDISPLSGPQHLGRPCAVDARGDDVVALATCAQGRQLTGMSMR